MIAATASPTQAVLGTGKRPQDCFALGGGPGGSMEFQLGGGGWGWGADAWKAGYASWLGSETS